MTRRIFLICAGLSGVGLILYFVRNPSLIRRAYYRIEDIFKGPLELHPDSEKSVAALPFNGKNISVELAINSRCSSDYDGNTKKFHWGMFDIKKIISDDQTDKIIQLSKTPRFTDSRVEIQKKRNKLTFIIDKSILGPEKDSMMVESGMQQQAVCLVCAALGVGMIFSSFGRNGIAISDKDYATVAMTIDALKPSYNDLYWSSSQPSGSSRWLRGNLSDPIRDGNLPLLSTLKTLKLENKGVKKTTNQRISQLLWAARGRTPHFYQSRPWGMTIPTFRGEQNNTSVYVISDHALHKYFNWDKNRPTHSIKYLSNVETGLNINLAELFPSWNTFIIVEKNDRSDVALYEVGYQLLNLLLQAKSMDLFYRAILLNENQKKYFNIIGVNNPVFVLMLK